MKRSAWASVLMGVASLAVGAEPVEMRLVVDEYRGPRQVFRIHAAEARLELLPNERVLPLPRDSERINGWWRAARELNIEGGIKPTWVEFSPDCKRMLLQFHERGEGKRLKPPEYGERTPWRKAGEFPTHWDNQVADAAWSADGRYLVGLERDYRLKKTPGSMFRYLFGHGDIHTTYAVVVLDTATGKSNRIVVADDISGTAMLLMPARPCPAQ